MDHPLRRRRMMPNPARPAPNTGNEAGSGVPTGGCRRKAVDHRNVQATLVEKLSWTFAPVLLVGMRRAE